MRKNHTLGDLPLTLRRERQHGKRVLDPGSTYITDWINRYTLTLLPFEIGTVSQRILPANQLRTYLIVQSKTGGIIRIAFGQNADAFTSLDITPGGFLEFTGGATGGAFSPKDDIYLIGSAANLQGVIGEGLWSPDVAPTN